MSTQPPPSNPWEALFASATRPQAPAGSCGGYTILVQHSMTPRSHRRWALASTAASNDERPRPPRGGASASLESSVASMTLKPPTARRAPQGSWFGAAGPFLVGQAFEELSRRCDGALVFVSTLGLGGVLDLDAVPDESNFGDEEGLEHSAQMLRNRRHSVKMFHKNGARVDLFSDPFGWEEASKSAGVNLFEEKSTTNKLQPITMAIRRAAASVESRRIAIEGQEQSRGKSQYQRPTPIVFESLTPLLNFHGAEKISLFLKSLGRGVVSSAMVSPGEEAPILSPIVAPVLYESLSPAEHRYLEDMAHAMVHLNLPDTRGSVNSSSSSYGPDSLRSISGVVDLARRGCGGVGGGLGGKFICHCIPIQIIRAPTTLGSCYWVLDNDRNETEKAKEKQPKTKPSSVSTGVTSTDQKSPAVAPTRPRIYLQDDDPEFDDFDEEDDLDDDLDI